MTRGVSQANALAQSEFDAACADLRCFRGDPMGKATSALLAQPDWAMPSIFMAWLHVLGTEPTAGAQALALLSTAKPLLGMPQETQHWHAAHALASGRWTEASDRVLAINQADPHDALALQIGHQIDFFTGNTSRLLSRIAEALPLWDREQPAYHAVLAMHAFGLEENGMYSQAESAGREAVELQPHDGWAWHAVAHVMEMQNRRAEGIAWYASSTAWHEGSFFSVHNHWHWALFHLGLDQVDEVLALYDQRVVMNSPLAINLLDASSLLWRLMLRGVNVDARWQDLADRWAPHASTSTYAFNDFHAMMAFAMAGRSSLAERLLEAQQQAMTVDTGSSGNGYFLREVGHPATLAALAYARGEYQRVIDLLTPVLHKANAFGGSHAQREVLALTLHHSSKLNSQGS